MTFPADCEMLGPAGASGRDLGVDMFTNSCLEHQTANTPDARAHVNVPSTTGITAMWDFATKPYARQRPPGAPPG